MDATPPGHDAPPPDPVPVKLRASDEDRRTTETLLADAYSVGQLDYTEYRERSDKVWNSIYTADLAALTRDVQARPGQDLPTPAPGHVSLSRVTGSSGPSVSLGILSGQERNGSWTCPARHTVVTTMGGVQLDLRNAVFESADTTITCYCLMGGVNVIVPDDIDIEVSGIGVMGGFGASRAARDVTRPQGGIRVRINGIALMGGVGVERKGEDD